MPDINALNSLDWIILGIVVWSVVWAAFRGFSREVFSILTLIAAFIITGFAGHLLDGPLSGMLPDNAIAGMFGRAIVFLVCIIIINLIAGLGAKALRALLSGVVDHSLGLLFGFLRAAIIVVLPFLLVNLYIDPKVYPDWLTHAHAYPFLEGSADVLRRVLPASQIADDKRTDFGGIQKVVEQQEKLMKDIEKYQPAKPESKKPDEKPSEDKPSDSKHKDKKTKDSSESTSNLGVKELITMLKELTAK